VDLGAESGRAIVGALEGGTLALEETHRFPNIPVRVFSAFYWDTLRLWHEIQQGIAIASRGRELAGMAIDTWGVDFALLGEDGSLAANPRHYRDARNHGILEKMFERVPREEIFDAAGIQFMVINTLCQLYAMKLAGDPALGRARTLLMMPDLFNYWLTGVVRSERTIASTSQFCDPRTGKWAANLLGRFGLADSILPEIVAPGERLGAWNGIPVFTTASHDTASAVAAVPADTADWCYISSGTWSLMGVELDAPVINREALALNFTNELGFGGTTRLLKNIAGLWLLQECRRAWSAAGTDYSYEELTRLAEEARPFLARIDPDAFSDPDAMPEKIRAACAQSGQSVPETPGEIARTILESLAFRYRDVLESLERLLGRKLGTIHIVGGGSRNRLLNRLVADIAGRRVVAGPAEATAAGNILVQAIGSGDVANLAEARAVVRRSFPVEVFLPGETR
jgi:rhamnulokinase